MRALLLLGSVLLILLLAGLWVGNGSYPDRWRMQEEIKVQKAANELQKDNNRKIRAELDDVASGNDAIEERARSELGMTRKGETFYEVVLQPDPVPLKAVLPTQVHDSEAKNIEKQPLVVPATIEQVKKEKKRNEQAGE